MDDKAAGLFVMFAVGGLMGFLGASMIGEQARLKDVANVKVHYIEENTRMKTLVKSVCELHNQELDICDELNAIEAN